MSFNKVLLPITCFIVICGTSSDDVYVINTNGSKIIGRKLNTIFEDKPFAAFWKIPYAVPPIGKLRFKVNNLFHILFTFLKAFFDF